MNYIGSKDFMSKQLSEVLNTYIEENNIQFFVDWFAGGLNVTKNINAPVIIANDIDKSLTLLYNNLYLREFSSEFPYGLPVISKEEYYKLKESEDSWVRGLAKTQFSFRNVPWGGYTTDQKIKSNLRKLKATFELIQQKPNITFWNTNFNGFIHQIAFQNIQGWEPSKVLMYLDPPYFYSNKVYGCEYKFDYIAFIFRVKAVVRQGYHVILSEQLNLNEVKTLFGCEVKLLLEVDKGGRGLNNTENTFNKNVERVYLLYEGDIL